MPRKRNEKAETNDPVDHSERKPDDQPPHIISYGCTESGEFAPGFDPTNPIDVPGLIDSSIENLNGSRMLCIQLQSEPHKVDWRKIIDGAWVQLDIVANVLGTSRPSKPDCTTPDAALEAINTAITWCIEQKQSTSPQTGTNDRLCRIRVEQGNDPRVILDGTGYPVNGDQANLLQSIIDGKKGAIVSGGDVAKRHSDFPKDKVTRLLKGLPDGVKALLDTDRRGTRLRDEAWLT